MSTLKPTRLARVLLWAVNFFFAATLFLVGASMVTYLLFPLVGMSIPAGEAHLSVTATYQNPPDLQGNPFDGIGVAQLTGHDWTSLRITSPGLQAAGAVANFIFLAMLVLVAHQLRAFLRSVTAGAPFIADNPRRIRNIGSLIIAADVFASTWTWLLSRYIAPHLTLEGVLFTPRFDFNWTQLLLGFLILLIAQIFELGVQLEDEQALTV